MKSNDAWDQILDPGEQVIWQGRPDAGFAPHPFRIFEGIFGLFFASFALFWMTQAAKGGGGFWMFGLLHFSVGVGIILHALFWDSFKRNRTWYTLSDRRAFIATDLPLLGKRLASYVINEDADLRLIDGSPASVFFASETMQTKGSVKTRPIGFERIADGKAVYRKIRNIQLQSADRSADT
ncbi:aspartate carbamoyltransferase catalytic subunit [Ruegeria sp. ANG-S4]|uniref:hypothetical protein n=1 Tax=Ruegeria sp. ANG-S4 TaxID=1577904 RepID=UPI00057CC915|nr:hypothetical protein [Ruegeria sp. ANG-S4]KIC46477.1 aspartate carbamoyltransferase catalytic subunit [Ruegeria sp. ANG-S4]